MAVTAILTIIGSIIAGVWSGIKFVSSKALTLSIAFFDMMKKGFDWFLSTSPRYLQILIFFFLIIIVADTVVGFFVNLNYACLSDDELRTPHSFAGGVGMYLEGIFKDFENSTTDYDNFIQEHTVKSQQYSSKSDPRSMLYVRCIHTTPTLTFFGLDFLNYKYWIILIILGLMFKVGKDFNIL